MAQHTSLIQNAPGRLASVCRVNTLGVYHLFRVLGEHVSWLLCKNKVLAFILFFVHINNHHGHTAKAIDRLEKVSMRIMMIVP